MGEYWIPPEFLALEPAWRNFFDNMAAVQFEHRVLAITTFLLIIAYWTSLRKADLPDRIRRGVNALVHTAVLQVALGIATLLLVVPIFSPQATRRSQCSCSPLRSTFATA